MHNWISDSIWLFWCNKHLHTMEDEASITGKWWCRTTVNNARYLSININYTLQILDRVKANFSLHDNASIVFSCWKIQHLTEAPIRFLLTSFFTSAFFGMWSFVRNRRLTTGASSRWFEVLYEASINLLLLRRSIFLTLLVDGNRSFV